MSNLPYIGMKGYNERGMTGNCREAARGAAIGIGTAIGGPIGGTIAGVAFTYFEDDIFGTQGLLGVIGMNKSTAFQAARLKQWFNEKFTPWQEVYFTDLSGLSDEDFKDKINDMILNLETIRLMYELEKEKQYNTRKGMNKGTDFDIPELSDIETKADAFKYLVDMIRDVFLEKMKEGGKKPGKGLETKTVKNFKPEYYLNLDAPENINYTTGAKTDVDVYVFSENEELNLNIDRSVDNESNGNDQIGIVKSIGLPSRLYKPKKEESSVFSSLPLLIAGYFGGKYAYKKFIKGSSKN